ncbi:ABC-type dipeptide/oligopeptide/nickel transport system permease subunit [Cytobacillus purgationiresistens]|uniref:ABC-type dipeptide/oligopeptide/nickel transport system permease subunit n=1 Tax=Cytobacillus purgationiresistens TaxID=863449 RepID=A0ABU0AIF1_9BACI|nr:ABC-type dipeptide/oligopeptide/nickel transport system permease subunit [Cytobacillus purgationiresistens]
MAILLFVCIFGPMLAPHSLTTTLEVEYKDGKVVAPPLTPFESLDYPLGTDKWGYDLLSMILNGLRYTVFIAVAVTIIKMLFGTIIGMYIGTWRKVPSFIVAFENAWSYVPLFLILYFFLTPINYATLLEPNTLVASFIIIASMISIPSIVSSIRQKTGEIKQLAYIEAAKTLGAKRNRLIWNHIFPQLKESLLVMFILEIVYVITIMGQLALVNIFIGGTIVRYDPLIYLSVTKELSGLVGQARGNVYGNTHILIVPLIILLFTTIAFSMLASGLKNKFQSDYQRTPWIKTGHEPKMYPKRKQYDNAGKFYQLSPNQLAFLALSITFVAAGCYVYFTNESNIGVKQESHATYDLSLDMNNSGAFTASGDLEIKNLSNDDWDSIVLYQLKGISGAEIDRITINKKEVDYVVSEETIKIKLPEEMKSKGKHQISMSYSFNLPEEGKTLLAEGGTLRLTEWYPKAAVYQAGEWKIGEEIEGINTHYTNFSDFGISYQLPEGYSIASSADKDAASGQSSGNLKMKDVREFSIVLLKDMEVIEKQAREGVGLRLFSGSGDEDHLERTWQLANRALQFFQEEVGEYPFKQLDIILDQPSTQSYPGIITMAVNKEDDKAFDYELVQMIAQQYFKAAIASDPYNHAWISEGMSAFAASLYLKIAENQSESQAFAVPIAQMKKIEIEGLRSQRANVPLDELIDIGFISGQPALQINQMVNEHFHLQGYEVNEVSSKYLADFYKQYQFSEVDTKEYIQFTSSYFSVPRGSFNNWLSTKASR